MADAQRPLLLLDVDGVLNAISKKGDRSAWSDWKSGVIEEGSNHWPIVYSPTVTASVRSWHERDLAEIRWLADWGDLANGDLRELLELPAFPVVPAVAAEDSAGALQGADAGSDRTEWWKFSVVKALTKAESERPIVWVDDDLRHNRVISNWMHEHTTSLIIAPPTHLGLTPKHLRLIESFLCQYANAF